MLRAAFKLPLRQIKGLTRSVPWLMGLTISAPDHTTISRRAVTLLVIQATPVPHGRSCALIVSTGLQVHGAGQWLKAKRGATSRRKWRKLHLAVDAVSGMIVAQTLAWQIASDYDRCSLVETIMGRYKSLVGPRLRALGFAGQQTEAAIGVAVLNRMLAAGRKDSIRRQPVIT